MTTLQQYTVALADCAGQSESVGGKAVGLARLIGFGFDVPPGFVVTTGAYLESVTTTGISDRIEMICADESLDNADRSAAIGKLFSSQMISPDAVTAIRASYRRLCGDRGEVAVAVRSSATAEDLATASFAGQQDTYLGVRGEEAVLDKVASCWASLFSFRAIEYRSRFDGLAAPAMGVVVQEMVDAAAAGVMMTLDPVSGDRSTICIEASHGLGESVVRGEVSPDRYVIDRDTLAVRVRETGDKPTMWVPSARCGEAVRVEVPEALREAESLTVAEAVALAEAGRDIDTAFGMPVDVEWALDRGSRRCRILQARPETVWSNKIPSG